MEKYNFFIERVKEPNNINTTPNKSVEQIKNSQTTTTCKMRQAVRTRNGRAKPVLSRGGGGGSHQIPTQTTLELHSDSSFTDDSKNQFYQ
jgi:hypothetical protein